MNCRIGIKSDFSIGRSLLTIEKIVKNAVEAKYDGVVVTDDMTISAMPFLSNALKDKGIKMVFGVTLFVYEDATYRPPRKSSGEIAKENQMYTLKVYAKGEKGIKSIFKLLTLANTSSHFYYNPRTQLSEVLELEDVVISTGDFFNLFSYEKYEEVLVALINKFGKENVFLEHVLTDNPLFERTNVRAIQCWQKYHCPVLGTLPALYESDKQLDSLNVYQAVYKNMPITAEKCVMLNVQKIGEYSFKIDNARLTSDVLEPLVRIYLTEGEISEYISQCMDKSAEKLFSDCEYEFQKKAPCLPKLADNEFAEVVRQCKEGWKKRFTKPVLGYLPPKEKLPEYVERLKYELSVLQKMNFSGYFLVVSDMVRWSKSQGIVVGPGRGSCGGSLVAYLMGITEVDPIRFNLFFERFINPERHDLPDADLDYQSTRRQEVIDYLQEKYGKDCVAGISNYGTLGSASAIRDVGRIFGLPLNKLEVSKLVPKEHGFSSTLEECVETVPEIKEFAKENPKLWSHSLALQNVKRSLGRHAAGTIVAGEPLKNRAVVETRSGSAVVNWDKRIVEDMGLIKMDILGLSTLDTLQIALNYIKERHGREINLLDISLDDEATLDAFGRGETTGVFQFESPGMKNLLKNLATSSRLTFEDITTATALYRPGPMDSGLLDDFVRIKKGYKTIFYDHPNMERVLKETCGVMVYQEQVMQVARDLAGFTMGEADLLRRAMGKKQLDKMKLIKEKFIKGANTISGMSEDQAEEIFNKIEKFASYGFNKSHSVEYSIISYWSCFLRTHFPAEYFAASLSIIDDDKYESVVKDAGEAGIEILPPQINHSSDRFEVLNKHQILAPFSSVKFISGNIAKKIVALRKKNGPFKSVEEFKRYAAMTGSGVNKRAVTNLELVGSFCEIDSSLPPVDDPSRIKDQKDLMGGLIQRVVKCNRTTTLDTDLRAQLRDTIKLTATCKDCDLCSKKHCAPSIGGTDIKYMVVCDCPNWEEEKKGKMMTGKGGKIIFQALTSAGMSLENGYFTSLVKAKKEDKFLSAEQIAHCSKYLDKEIELIKPSVIIALGSASIRKFVPSVKGAEADGQSFYVNGTTVVGGINPAQIYFDGNKIDNLISTFKSAKEVLS